VSADVSEFPKNLSQVDPLVIPEEFQSDFIGNLDIRWLLEAESAGSSACFFRCIFPVGGAHTRHTHPSAGEFLYIVRGYAGAGLGDTEKEVTAGTILYSPAGETHWIRNVSESEELEFVGGYVGAVDLEAAGYEAKGPITDEYRQVPIRS
jgi:quercetin dioxygenase-like cupin family protein